MSNKNLSFSLLESKKNTPSHITYEDLLITVDEMNDNIPEHYEYDSMQDMYADDYIASELDYQTNYIKKQLDHIANYYNISKRKKRKDQLITDIVLYEKDPMNIEKVYQRKKLWKYIEEIKKDTYLKQFLILD
jgi:hypothetical protein